MYIIYTVREVQISIHALREEGDRRPRGRVGRALPFLSTPSARRATGIFSFLGAFWGISIHALREEGDRAGAPTPQPARDFYPRPPRGGRLNRVKDDVIEELFLSTPSARRATME